MSMDLHNKGASFKRQILADAEQRARDLISGIGATIAAQKDGAAVSDQHRALNFQGPGVTVTDDPAMRRTNVFVPGAPTSTASTVIHSSPAAQVFDLWNGSGNNAPAASWYTAGFNHTGWPAATNVASNYAGLTGSVLAGLSVTHALAEMLLWQTYSVPAGSVSSASLQIACDDVLLAVYVNGTAVGASQWGHDFGTTPAAITIDVPVSVLTPGATNSIAVWVRNDSDTGNVGAAYTFTISTSGAGTDTQYELVARKGVANGYASLDSGGLVPTSQLPALTSGAITIREVDTSPSVSAGIFELPNGTLTDMGGGVARYTPSSTASVPFIKVEDQKTSGTSGGGFTAGAWRTRTLNTETTDSGSIASLASNRVNLPAGTYHCRISAPGYFVEKHQIRLQNITASTTLLTGTTEYSGAASNGSVTRSFIDDQFVLSATSDLEVQHWCTTTNGTNGFGVAGGIGTEVYTTAAFEKIA